MLLNIPARFLTLLLAMLCASLTLTAQTNKKIKKLQSERTTLEKQISESEKMLKTTKKDVASQLNNLMVISSQITKQQNYVQSVHNEVSALQGDITSLQKQLKVLEKDLADCKQKYRRAVTQLNRNRLGQSKWKFILSANSFRQMSRRMRYITEYSKYQRAQGDIIRQKEDTIKAKRAELLATKQEKNALLQEGKEQQARLEQQKQDRQKVVNSLNAKQKQLQNTIAQNKKRQKQLDARIDKLIQEEIAAAERRRKEAEARRRAEAERKRKEEERRRAAANKKTSASNKKSSTKPSKPAERTATPRFYEEDNADRAVNGSFQANKGRLPMPITGSYFISAHYGQYNVEGLRGVQLDNKGINITGHPGAQARSVFAGEVTAIFSLGGMHNVIVRHGSYMSVYCNLASCAVKRGQKVTARQVLGRVAADASGNCTLHFQLRREREKLNPEPWLGR
ncbi:MAG: peptidoglycan DD-metalloendopeptidase family protein [Bacteroidales bacterium]|nr:peptidoglycan DD-metalloendopeptidase family protein [Bacteroidales bacterium]